MHIKTTLSMDNQMIVKNSPAIEIDTGIAKVGVLDSEMIAGALQRSMVGIFGSKSSSEVISVRFPSLGSQKCGAFAACVALVLWSAALPAFAQDDVTTQHATSAYAGGYITGPAS